MKKLMIFFLFNLILIVFSCNDICIIDKEFKSEFDNCILYVELLNKEGNNSDINLRASTYECLYAITGFEGHVEKGNEPHYFYPYSDTIEYVEYDIKEWKKWYEKNKYIITKSMADSIITKHGIEFGFPNLKWPSRLTINR